MKPHELHDLAPGQWVRWTPSIVDSPIDGQVHEITEYTITIHWDDGQHSTMSRDRLVWGTFELLSADDGVTQLQCDILERLERAGISEGYCDTIMQLIAAAERARSE